MSAALRRTALPTALLTATLACGTGGGAPATGPSALPAATPAPADNRYPVAKVAFGPIYGSGCPDFGACGCGDAKTLAEEASCQLDHLVSSDIPVTGYLFDGYGWSKANSSLTDTCTGPDCCVWNLGDGLIQQLKTDNVRALLHFWGGCHNAEQYQRAYGKLGSTLLGFYLDDGSSDTEAQDVVDYMQSVAPNRSASVLKAYQNREPSTSPAGLASSNVCYVGDLPYTFDGLGLGIERVLNLQHEVAAPFNELTGYGFGDDGAPDEETYIRRLHFGCFQPVMAHTPYANADPWLPQYSPRLLDIYRYYTWLHKELVPYLYGYAYGMFEDPSDPAARVLRSGPTPNSFAIGNELFVAIVTSPTSTLSITLPPDSSWIDYWDESALLSGTQDYPVPLGHEPIFIKSPAIIPMDVERDYTGHGTSESRGSLTVLVYPGGETSFRYRDEKSSSWITITAAQDGDALSLDMSPAMPSVPVIYRIGRWKAAPTSVGRTGSTTTINLGGGIAAVGSEQEVNGAAHDAWYYDADAHRLIVKVLPQ